ncbi:hypothetical protein LTR48_003043 [Friedmanniomyces endolithicus]|uniref:Uncharacterized protein n=1 Tax=Rachicladosporium monterosium TaxID=1507873 RepID=A0ABR0L9E0_9PEZI|nr:hypothetical protein LTR48_003043 [Friedmanniomyces endolithicus]KAK5145501.1 hypothetical protein LTR32_002756 [Rachicladosporium monterosium]
MIGHNTFEFFGVPRDLRDRNYHKLLLVTAERRGEDMDCCITGRDIALHKRWIPVLLAKLSQLTSLTVDVHIPYQCGNAEKRSALVKHVSALTTLSGLEAITVIVNPGVRYEDVARWDYTSLDKQKVMTWKRTTGEFLDFEP